MGDSKSGKPTVTDPRPLSAVAPRPIRPLAHGKSPFAAISPEVVVAHPPQQLTPRDPRGDELGEIALIRQQLDGLAAAAADGFWAGPLVEQVGRRDMPFTRTDFRTELLQQFDAQMASKMKMLEDLQAINEAARAEAEARAKAEPENLNFQSARGAGRLAGSIVPAELGSDDVSAETIGLRVDACVQELEAIAADQKIRAPGGGAATCKDILGAFYKRHKGQWAAFADTDEWAQKQKQEWGDEAIQEHQNHHAISVDEAILLRDQHLTVRAYSHLRLRLHLDEWPSYKSQKPRMTQLNDEVMRKLGLQSVPNAARDADMPDLVEIVEIRSSKKRKKRKGTGDDQADADAGGEFCGASVELLKLVQHIILMSPGPSPEVLDIRVSVDGADLAGRKAELIALIPMWWDNTQSLHAVFPLCIYIGKETRTSLARALPNVKAEQEALTLEVPDSPDGLHHRVHWKLSSDMFALHKILWKDKADMAEEEREKRGACVVCPGKKLMNGWVGIERWMDENGKWRIPDTELPDCIFYVASLADVAPCGLHANLRISPVIWKKVLEIAVQSDVESSSSKHVDAVEAAVRGAIKGFHIGRAGEWNGQDILKTPTWPTMRGDQLKKLHRSIPAWSDAIRASGATGKTLLYLLNTLNYWILIHKLMLFRPTDKQARLDAAQLTDFCDLVTRFEAAWTWLKLSVTPHGELCTKSCTHAGQSTYASLHCNMCITAHTH